MKSLLSVLIMLTSCISVIGQSAESIINASISYHDPKDILDQQEWKMTFEESRPDGAINETYYLFNPKTYDFEVMRNVKGFDVIMRIEDGLFSSEIVGGQTDLKIKEVGEQSTSEERATMFRDYYHYLWCMPMKLKDPGTIIDPEVKTIDFFGKESLQIKVTYTPEVGEDTWYFYFHPETKALQGYRFYHDESANDGEYILLEGEFESNGVRIPQSRKWMTHKEDKFLGTDKLVGLELH